MRILSWSVQKLNNPLEGSRHSLTHGETAFVKDHSQSNFRAPGWFQGWVQCGAFASQRSSPSLEVRGDVFSGVSKSRLGISWWPCLPSSSWITLQLCLRSELLPLLGERAQRAAPCTLCVVRLFVCLFFGSMSLTLFEKKRLGKELLSDLQSCPSSQLPDDCSTESSEAIMLLRRKSSLSLLFQDTGARGGCSSWECVRELPQPSFRSRSTRRASGSWPNSRS